MRQLAKSLVHGCALALVSPAGLLCRLEQLTGRERVYQTFVQLFACAPGLAGMALRRAFYCWTLRQCDPQCYLGFGVLLNHREATIGRHAYIGDYAIIGRASIGARALIGSRVSLLSGGRQHERTPDGHWTVGQGQFTPIAIGEDVWVGEAAVIMADVGRGAMVAAGAVVSAPVNADVMVAGNPARFVKRLPTAGTDIEAAPSRAES